MTQNYLYYFPKIPQIAFPSFYYFQFNDRYRIIAQKTNGNYIEGEMHFDFEGFEPIQDAWGYLAEHQNIPCLLTEGFGINGDKHDLPYGKVFGSLLLQIDTQCRIFERIGLSSDLRIDEITKECKDFLSQIIFPESKSSGNLFLNEKACIVMKYLANKTLFYAIDHFPQDIKELKRICK